MEKKTKQKITLLSMAILFVAIFSGWNTSFRHLVQDDMTIATAHAGDDENEYEGGDDNFSAPSSTSEKTKKVKSVPTYQKVLVNKVITTLDPVFTTDQDNDGLVDGLDPHPTVSESEYFTDDDNDGIANAFDMHKGDDDFAYYEQEDDANGNGILDSYESLASN